MEINAVPPAKHVWMELGLETIVMTPAAGKHVFLMRMFLPRKEGYRKLCNEELQDLYSWVIGKEDRMGRANRTHGGSKKHSFCQEASRKETICMEAAKRSSGPPQNLSSAVHLFPPAYAHVFSNHQTALVTQMLVLTTFACNKPLGPGDVGQWGVQREYDSRQRGEASVPSSTLSVYLLS
jgi:hypothetical protein